MRFARPFKSLARAHEFLLERLLSYVKRYHAEHAQRARDVECEVSPNSGLIRSAIHSLHAECAGCAIRIEQLHTVRVCSMDVPIEAAVDGLGHFARRVWIIRVQISSLAGLNALLLDTIRPTSIYEHLLGGLDSLLKEVLEKLFVGARRRSALVSLYQKRDFIDEIIHRAKHDYGLNRIALLGQAERGVQSTDDADDLYSHNLKYRLAWKAIPL